MTDKPLNRLDDLKEFDDELLAANVPVGSRDPNQNNIRVYPQLKPILIDWISNYRTRLPPGFPWHDFVFGLNGITLSSGEQPEVLTALITEFRNLCDLDFEKIVPPEQYHNYYASSFITGFSPTLAYSAGPGDYDRLRELVFDPKSRAESGTLISFYFGKSKNKDVPNVISEAFKEDGIGIRLLAAEVAGLRGFTQFLPEVRELNRVTEGSDDYYWEPRMQAAVHRLEKKRYADTHAGSGTDELIRDLDDETVAPYAAYLLGVRKDPAALESLRRKTTSPVTKVRQEAKTAVKKIEKLLKP